MRHNYSYGQEIPAQRSYYMGGGGGGNVSGGASGGHGGSVGHMGAGDDYTEE